MMKRFASTVMTAHVHTISFSLCLEQENEAAVQRDHQPLLTDFRCNMLMGTAQSDMSITQNPGLDLPGVSADSV